MGANLTGGEQISKGLVQQSTNQMAHIKCDAKKELTKLNMN